MRGREPREYAAVFVGGAVGTVMRVWLGLHLVVRPGEWPWSTFAVNIVAAFVLGFVSEWLVDRPAHHHSLVGTGLCGGLSTFSTMQVEVVRLLQRHDWGIAIGYTVASIAAGLLVVRAGAWLADRGAGRGPGVDAGPDAGLDAGLDTGVPR